MSSNVSKALAEKAVNGSSDNVNWSVPLYTCRKSYSHVVAGVKSVPVERPLIVNVKMEPSRVDQSYNRPVAKIIEEFQLAGKVLSDIRSSQYDFPDGRDDGRRLDATQDRSNTFEDINVIQKAVDMSLAENLSKDVEVAKSKKVSKASESVSESVSESK